MAEITGRLNVTAVRYITGSEFQQVVIQALGNIDQQRQDEFDAFMEDLQNTLSGSVVGNLQNGINSNKTLIQALNTKVTQLETLVTTLQNKINAMPTITYGNETTPAFTNGKVGDIYLQLKE